MKVSLLFGIAVLSFVVTYTKDAYSQVVENSPRCSLDTDVCDFSDYKRLKDPDSLFTAVVKKVNPDYPPTAQIAGAQGKVIVRILVDRKGDVLKACITEGHPLLRAASLEAAKRWKFEKNFGFVDSEIKERFAEVDLIFNFEIP